MRADSTDIAPGWLRALPRVGRRKAAPSDADGWRPLASRLVLGLAAIAAVAVGSTLLLSSSLARQEEAAQATTTAVYQNVLSHQLVDATRDLTTPDVVARERAAASLRAIRAEMAATGVVVSTASVDGSALTMQSVDGQLAAMLSGTEAALAISDAGGQPDAALLDDISMEAAMFRAGMDNLVFDLQRDAAARADSMRRAEILLMGFTIVLLALEGLFLFRPAVRQVRRSWHERGIRHAEEQDRQRRRMRDMEQFDALTGLANRSLLRDRLQEAMLRAKQDGGLVSLLLLDLDHFKSVNDRLGPETGDRLLRAVAGRIDTVVRDDDLVARLGGDEFAIVIEGRHRAEDAGTVAGKVLRALAEPYDLDDGQAFVTASIGIVAYPLDGDQVDDLLRDADIAMYSAKEAGRNGYHFFTADLRERTAERLRLIDGLRRALDSRDELRLVYQPKIDVATGTIVGVEALLRWHHPDLGVVLPGRFIPVAEETDLMVPLGRWVLAQACAQAREWAAAGHDQLRISVNVSSRQFRHGDLAETVSTVLAEAELDPRWLEVELTEGTLIEDTEQVHGTLERLKEMGVQVSIDDFGTGYSSLSYLKRFPIDTLKIDRSFISEITTDHDDAAISQAIVSMARSLRLNVIAEGVETEEQLEAVRELGCDAVQGFLFSRPLEPDAVRDFASSLVA